MKTDDVNRVIEHMTKSMAKGWRKRQIANAMAGSEVMSDKEYALGNFKSYLDFKRKRNGENIMVALDMETCNNITRLTLTEYRDYLQSELDQWNENPKDDDNPEGYWLHPEDVVGNMKRIKRINLILNDFGGELYGNED
jgi:hypothetical protein